MTTLPMVIEQPNQKYRIQLKPFGRETGKPLALLEYRIMTAIYFALHYQDTLRLTETPISNRYIRKSNRRQLKKRFGKFCKILRPLQRLSGLPEHERKDTMDELINDHLTVEPIQPNSI